MSPLRRLTKPLCEALHGHGQLVKAPRRPVEHSAEVSQVYDVAQRGYRSERPVGSNREGVRLRATVLQQVEALTEWPVEHTAGAKRPDAIGEQRLSCLCAFLELINCWQRRINLDAHIPCKGRAAVADDQVQQRARHLIRAHIHPHVWLGGIDAELLLDLRLFFSGAGCAIRGICGLAVVGQRLQRYKPGAAGRHGGDGGRPGRAFIPECSHCMSAAPVTLAG